MCTSDAPTGWPMAMAPKPGFSTSASNSTVEQTTSETLRVNP